MDILELTKKLISIDTTPPKKKNLELALDLVRGELRGFKIDEFECNGYKSILVYDSKKDQRNFDIILNGHLDIIPGKSTQYNPFVKGSKLYGAGSMDMKSNVACLVSSFKEIVKKVPNSLALQIVTDEEIGGFWGTKYQIDKGVSADFVISGETTNFGIVNQAKGILWLEVVAKGKTAHGAYPWEGINAIAKMNEFINKLNSLFPEISVKKWESTLNLSSIKTNNTAYNKIPDECKLKMDIRFIPNEAEIILEKIKDILPDNVFLKVVTNEPALFVDKNNIYLKKLKKDTEDVLGKQISFYSAQGSSDARHYARKGIAAVEFGPIGGGIGTDEEWVNIDSLDKYCKILNKFILNNNLKV